VLAARRQGIKTVILPALNEKDLRKLPQSARDEMEFILVDHIEQVLAVALPEVSKRLGPVAYQARVIRPEGSSDIESATTPETTEQPTASSRASQGEVG
jgi:predicted ATP-dependent protease